MPTKAKATKQTVTVEEKGAPSPETLAAIPAKKAKGARPSMTKNPSAESALSKDNQSAVSDTATLGQLVTADVMDSVESVEQFEKSLWGGRVGPAGLWTRIVRKFVHQKKDWDEVRSLYRSTLMGTLRHKAKLENPRDAFPDISDDAYSGLIEGFVKSRFESSSYRTTLSQFDVIGRAFKVDKNKKLIGCGRDKILAILMGAEDAKGNKLPSPPGYQKVLSQAREAVGKDNRGRKSGTTNKNPTPTGPEQTGNPTTHPAAPSADVVTDPDKVSKLAREACLRNVLAYLERLPAEMQYLASVTTMLANKLKLIDNAQAQEVGAIMIDFVETWVEPLDVLSQKKVAADN